MSLIPISTLTSVSAISPNDIVVLDQNGTTYKGTVAQILANATLAGDADVKITNVNNGQVLTYSTSTSAWINSASSSSGAGSSTLSGLTDVSVGSPTKGYVVTYDPGGAGVSLIQKTTTPANATSITSASFTTAPIVGNTLVCLVTTGNLGSYAALNLDASWTVVPGSGSPSASYQTLAYIKTATSSDQNITINNPAVFYELGNCATAPNGIITTTSALTNVPANSIAFYVDSENNGSTPASGWTRDLVARAGQGTEAQYEVIATATSSLPTVTASSNNSQLAFYLIAKPTSVNYKVEAPLLANDSDVLISSPVDGQILTYVASASKWENKTPTTSPLSPPVYVQGNSKYTNNGNSGTYGALTFASAPGIGNVLVAIAYGGVYSVATGFNSVFSGNSIVVYAKVAASANASTDISPFSTGGGADGAFTIVELSGTSIANLKSFLSTGNGSPASIVATENNDLLISMLFGTGGNNPYANATTATGWTKQTGASGGTYEDAFYTISNPAYTVSGTTYAPTTYSASSASLTFTVAGLAGATLASDIDVLIASPTDGQVLTYVGSAAKWENKVAPVTTTLPLSAITGITVSNPVSGQVLTYTNSTSGFVNANPRTDYDTTILAESGLLHYYPMNEASGTAMVDAVSSGAINGTYGGTVHLRTTTLAADGKTCPWFNGSTGVGGQGTVSLPIDTSIQTIEFGILENQVTTGTTVIELVSTTGGNTSAFLVTENGSTGYLQFYVQAPTGGASSTSASSKILTSARSHVVATYNSTTGIFSMYVNGLFVTSANTSYTGDTFNSINIGSAGGTQCTNAVIGKFALYSTILTQAQIANHASIFASGITGL